MQLLHHPDQFIQLFLRQLSAPHRPEKHRQLLQQFLVSEHVPRNLSPRHVRQGKTRPRRAQVAIPFLFASNGHSGVPSFNPNCHANFHLQPIQSKRYNFPR
jgi:hypothetical protein